MMQKSDGLGLRIEIAILQALDPAKDRGTVKWMCVSILIEWLWWLCGNSRGGISMKDQAWHMKTHPDIILAVMAWGLAATGSNWVTGKLFRIKLMLLWILLSGALLPWGCYKDFWSKVWNCFLVFCLFMTWYRSTYCLSGLIFPSSFKHYLSKCLFQNLPFVKTNMIYFPCTSTMFTLFPFPK